MNGKCIYNHPMRDILTSNTLNLIHLYKIYIEISFRHHADEALYNWEGVPRALEAVPCGSVHGLHVSERHGGVHEAYVPCADVWCPGTAACTGQVLSRMPAS